MCAPRPLLGVQVQHGETEAAEAVAEASGGCGAGGGNADLYLGAMGSMVPRMILRTRAGKFGASKARRSVTSSYSTQPSAQMSLFWLYGLPGGHGAGHTARSHTLAQLGRDVARRADDGAGLAFAAQHLADAKVANLDDLVAVTWAAAARRHALRRLSSMMFWVLRSRWRMLCACTCCSASTICTKRLRISCSSSSSCICDEIATQRAPDLARLQKLEDGAALGILHHDHERLVLDERVVVRNDVGVAEHVKHLRHSATGTRMPVWGDLDFVEGSHALLLGHLVDGDLFDDDGAAVPHPPAQLHHTAGGCKRVNGNRRRSA